MKINVISSLLVISFLAVTANAAGVRGGGDDTGLLFQGAITSAFKNLKEKDPEAFNKLKRADIDKIIKQTKFIVVDDALDVAVKDLIQNSVAVNNLSTYVVMINRIRWKAISDPHLQEGIGLHEVLSLAKLESTGSYPISAKYISMFGLEEVALSEKLQVDRLKQITAEKPKATPYEVLEMFFSEAISPASLADFDVIDDPQSNMICQLAWKDFFQVNFGEIHLAKSDVKVNEATPYRGPLFPAQPEQRKWLLNITFQGNWIPDRSLRYARLDQDAQELIEIIPSHSQGSYNVNLKLAVRKNNGMVAFRLTGAGNNISQNVRVPVQYGYCYRQ